MSLDSMRGILPQTLMALLIIKEQISSAWAVHLHMFQLPKNWVTLQYVHDHPCIPREHRGTGPTRAICHHPSSIMAYSSTGVSSVPSPTSASTSDSPCTENHGASSSDMYSPWSSVEYISPESLCLSESISGAQQL